MKLFHKNPIDTQDLLDEHFIRTADYDQLESTYNIHKYYPQFFHNDGISTPDLRDLIVDKPIYKDANKHVNNSNRNNNNNTQVATKRMMKKMLDAKCGRFTDELVKQINEKDVADKQQQPKDDDINRLMKFNARGGNDDFIWDIGQGLTIPENKGLYTYCEKEIIPGDLESETEVEQDSPTDNHNHFIFNDPFNAGKRLNHKLDSNIRGGRLLSSSSTTLIGERTGGGSSSSSSSKLSLFKSRFKRSLSHQPEGLSKPLKEDKKLIVSRDSKKSQATTTTTGNTLTHKISHTNNHDLYLVPNLMERSNSFDQTKSQITLRRKIIDKLHVGKNHNHNHNNLIIPRHSRKQNEDIIGMYLFTFMNHIVFCQISLMCV
ncbi:uncharacterized protein J8A68_005970 [[Candida] subhashii]|uniref:Uncharacterized protein n=1 Tax=[Candida] subhashii TaxID=561895 RepID=A0A8J5QG31_9ASCO|nr:uncharacterized protein J8A68_005970 [[Candida] subhashii]KAG7660551.1 hypothetical protein J8A68_005970 [[Candida] subhashii]